jgi:hypothetical protein
MIVVKHAKAHTEPTDESEDMHRGADEHGDVGPPMARSAAAKATSGIALRSEREDDDVEMVDERDLLDETGFQPEQAAAHGEHVDRSGARPSPKRPKAPQLLDGIRDSSPAVEAMAHIQARTPSVPPRPEKLSSVPPPLPTASTSRNSAAAAPAEPIEPIATTTSVTPLDAPVDVKAPNDAPVLEPPSEGRDVASSEAKAEPPPPVAEPVKHLPPPPRPLPPVPRPPPSLRSHLDVAPPATVREGRRRKPRDRQIELPSYAPGAVTLRTQRPSLPARPQPKGGLSWGWAAALILVGAGAYAAGTMGARDERAPSRAAAVAQNRTQLAATPDSPAQPKSESKSESSERNEATPEAAPDAAPAVESTPAIDAVAQSPAAAEPAADIARDVPKVSDTPTPATRADARSFAPRERETTTVAPPAPAVGLDSSAASTTLARAGAKAVSCTDPRGGEGTVSVTFLPSGNPVNERMNGSYNGTSVANCVEQIFRATRVAPFEGSATTVYYTVRLPGDGKPIN